MTKPNTKGLRTWIEVDKSALKHNYQTFRKLLRPGVRLLAVVKSNAYGHGLVETAQLLQQFGADWFGVDSVVEALTLRRERITRPILVQGYTLPEMFTEALSQNISLTISSWEAVKELARRRKVLARAKTKLKIHLKVDTGMHRQGFYVEELAEVLDRLDRLNHVEVEGVYSHLASAENPKHRPETKKQFKNFDAALRTMEKRGLKPIRHLLATSGLLSFPDRQYDLARIGLGLYGLWPAEGLRLRWKNQIVLRPVLTWKTIISEIKTVTTGEKIGYGFTETFKRRSRVAICPIGYWHGYARGLSGRSRVVVRGRSAKVAGQVSMDMVAVDMTDIKTAHVGDEVILLDGIALANQAAKICGTIPYEILTRINPLIKKFYV